MASAVEVRRAAERFVSSSPGIETRHVFSFGPHYDPHWTGHGPVVTCDEHRLAPGAGFAPHPHRELEVVSWVLEGALVHDGPGGRRRVPAGAAQRLTTGTGTVHSERAADVATRFVQLWVQPAAAALPVAYEQQRPRLPDDVVAPVLGWPGAELSVVRLASRAVLPPAELGLLVVTRGRAVLEGDDLAEGDAVRLTGTSALTLTARGSAEVLLWRGRPQPQA